MTGAVLSCMCSRCRGKVTFTDVEDYLAHINPRGLHELTEGELDWVMSHFTQLELFPSIDGSTP